MQHQHAARVPAHSATPPRLAYDIRWGPPAAGRRYTTRMSIHHPDGLAHFRSHLFYMRRLSWE